MILVPFHSLLIKIINLSNVQIIVHKQVKRFESLELYEKFKPSNRDDVYGKRVKSQVVEQKIPSTLFLVMQVQSQLLGPLQTPVDMPWR